MTEAAEMTGAAEMTEDTDREPTAGPDSVEARLRALRADVELLDQVVRDFLEPAAAAAPPGPSGPRFEPFYPSVEAWVVGQFAPTYARPLSPAVRWCARWWDHAEAISRLEALWRVWEVARLDELRGIAVWYRDFLDPQLAVLVSSGGPFAQCTVDRHNAGPPLPTVPAPKGWWVDDEPDREPRPDDSPDRPAGGGG